MLQRKKKKNGIFNNKKKPQNISFQCSLAVGVSEFLFEILHIHICSYSVIGIVSNWGVYVSICLEISRIFGIFILILFYFPQCRTWFSGIKVVLFVVLVDQKCFVLYHNDFKIVLFVILVDFDAPSSTSMYFWEVNNFF